MPRLGSESDLRRVLYGIVEEEWRSSRMIDWYLRDDNGRMEWR